MATIKSYTTVEQSRKLAEILPLESADMWFGEPIKGIVKPFIGNYMLEMQCREDKDYFKLSAKMVSPAWSLAALLDIIPKHIKNYNVLRTDIGEKDFSLWYDEVGYGVNDKLPDITMEYPIDACVEMILKLKELKLI